MNIECFREWVEPAIAPVQLCIGAWSDGPEFADDQYLAIVVDGGSRPGPASRYTVVDLIFADKANSSTTDGGQLQAYKAAKKIEDFFANTGPDRPFANVILITGIIGPKVEEGGRLSYRLSIEITT